MDCRGERRRRVRGRHPPDRRPHDDAVVGVKQAEEATHTPAPLDDRVNVDPDGSAPRRRRGEQLESDPYTIVPLTIRRR
jgi:hypothetical protein